jgi:hypothetical protein
MQAMTPSTPSSVCHRGVEPPSPVVWASTGTRAMTGTTHMSCAIRIAKVVRPRSLASSSRSASVPMTMAVDDMAKARPIRVGASHSSLTSSVK